MNTDVTVGLAGEASPMTSGADQMKITMTKIQIEQARVEDVVAIAALLRAAGLPSEDFAAHVRHFVVARAGGEIVGAVGAEVCGEEALLRSMVVAEGHRRTGLGTRLVESLDAAALAWGVRRWWLLTTTAEAFFAARGFQKAERGTAPERIRATGQFQGGCCASAVCMTRGRGGNGA